MADVNGMIVESVRDTIVPELLVYDKDKKQVGKVQEIHREPGYFTVRMRPLAEKGDNPFVNRELHVPFRLVTHIDPRELFLSISRDEVRRDYANPPPRTTRIEEEFGLEVAVTTEPSGYDGSTFVVRRASIDELKKTIIAGDRVFSSDPTELGTIKYYDPVAGWLSVTRDTMSKGPTLKVPVALVDSVDRENHQVYLISSQADLERMEHLLPE